MTSLFNPRAYNFFSSLRWFPGFPSNLDIRRRTDQHWNFAARRSRIRARPALGEDHIVPGNELTRRSDVKSFSDPHDIKPRSQASASKQVTSLMAETVGNRSSSWKQAVVRPDIKVAASSNQAYRPFCTLPKSSLPQRLGQIGATKPFPGFSENRRAVPTPFVAPANRKSVPSWADTQPFHSVRLEKSRMSGVETIIPDQMSWEADSRSTVLPFQSSKRQRFQKWAGNGNNMLSNYGSSTGPTLPNERQTAEGEVDFYPRFDKRSMDSNSTVFHNDDDKIADSPTAVISGELWIDASSLQNWIQTYLSGQISYAIEASKGLPALLSEL